MDQVKEMADALALFNQGMYFGMVIGATLSFMVVPPLVSVIDWLSEKFYDKVDELKARRKEL